MPALADLTWPRTTERLVVRPAVEADLETIWHYRRLDVVGRWMTDAPKDRDAFVTQALADGRVKDTLIVELDGAVIGDLMLKVEDAWGQGEVAEKVKRMQAEIGWCLDPAYGGRGYGTEAARELLRIAFSELGLHRVIALCFAANEPSWRLMERIGMRREGYHVQDSLHRDLGWVDGMTYAMVAGEWTTATDDLG